jgi:hypothetical protein
MLGSRTSIHISAAPATSDVSLRFRRDVVETVELEQKNSVAQPRSRLWDKPAIAL